MQTAIHYFLHLGFPLVIAWGFFRKRWRHAYVIMLATMLVDLDHLAATPVFEANRCSIQFHPMHSYYAMIAYFGLLFFRWPLRLVGVGLLFHMLTDLVDCLFTYEHCPQCLIGAPARRLVEHLASALGW